MVNIGLLSRAEPVGCRPPACVSDIVGFVRRNVVAVMAVAAAPCVVTPTLVPISPAAQGIERRPTLAIVGGTLIDVRTGRSFSDTTILIAGDRIQQVGPSGDINLTDGIPVVSARGRWIVPGFIDMHVHVSTTPDVPMELYVVNGVTAIRDLGGNLTALRMTRASPEAEDSPRPRLFFAGPILDGAAPSAPRISLIVDSPRRAASAVAFLVDQGVDAIKVYNNIREPALRAIVRAAAARGVPVVGHVPRTVTVARAVQLGMNGIEHALIRARDLEEWGLLSSVDADRIQAMPSVTRRDAAVWDRIALQAPAVRTLVAQLANNGVFFDPTLSIDEYDTLFLYDKEAQHPNNRYLKPSFVEANLGPEHEVFRLPSEMRAVAEAGLRKRQRLVAMSHQAGVPIIAGTDGPGIGGMAAGFGLHRELALLVEAGLPPLEALRAATINAARALRQEKRLATIEAGKLAGLIVLSANPLEDIRNSHRARDR